MLTKSRTVLVVLGLTIACVITVLQYAQAPSALGVLDYLLLPSGISRSRHPTLGVFSAIYVVSLPRRTDRRADMEYLRKTLRLDWTYIDATEADSAEIRNLLSQVRMHRDHSALQLTGKPTPFAWPKDIDALPDSNDTLLRGAADFWTMPSLPTPADASPYYPSPSNTTFVPLTCAERDDVVPPYSTDMPARKFLNASKVACWNSHLEVIQRIAQQPLVTDGTEKAALILEDDVDMEINIEERLAAVWDLLPQKWDMLFLGHCWSNQTHFPAITRAVSANESLVAGKEPSALHFPTLHPSYKPKCSHAYALTRSGARRLWLLLRHPPFAYSRAVDQAFAWLVESGRVTSFSIVPPLVVQRKVSASDVLDGLGSGWREGLENGVFGSGA